MSGRENARLAYPRHADYFWSVYGLGGYEPPCYLELACYEDAEKRRARQKFFRLDIGNLEAANYIDEDDFYDDADMRASYMEKLRLLNAGEVDYFIETLFFSDGSADLSALSLPGGQLPPGKTILDTRNAAGAVSDYAYVYVREARPLMPDVLCEWLEQLSPVLFGDRRAYRIPEDAYETREQAERSFAAAHPDVARRS